jgi:hypothetical protein
MLLMHELVHQHDDLSARLQALQDFDLCKTLPVVGGEVLYDLDKITILNFQHLNCKVI